MVIDEDIYIEHFGVKGQKWGVRKQRTASEQAKFDKRKAVAKKVAIGTVVAGAGVAAVILARRNVKMRSLSKAATTKVGAAKTASLFGQGSGKIPVSKIPTATKASPMRKETADFLKKFNAKQTEINRAANAQLRAKDNELNIPIYMRSYLPDWD